MKFDKQIERELWLWNWIDKNLDGADAESSSNREGAV